MTIKELKNRWFESDIAIKANKKIINTAMKGGELSSYNTPFKLLNDEISDFRGIDFGNIKITKLSITNADLSYCDFSRSWIENSEFTNIKFLKSDFSEISDHRNLFLGANFKKCNFKKAVLGYEGSIYSNCIIEDSNFTNTLFIRSEFNNSSFINNKLNGIDFLASSFDECSFEGELVDVWFRGGYDTKESENDFGKPKKNKMLNVDFRKAKLIDTTFSNDCDLSTIKLPNDKKHFLINDLEIKLNKLRIEIDNWSDKEKEETSIFIKIYIRFAKNQKSEILNIDVLKKEYGEKLSNKMINFLLDLH